MGIKHAIKKKLIGSAMNKRKNQNPFDAGYSDKYELPADAAGDKNNSHYISVHDLSSKESFYMRLGRRGGEAKDEVWLVYRDKAGIVYMIESDHIKKGDSIPAKVECIEGGKLLKFSFDGIIKKAMLTEKGYVPDPASEEIKFKAELDFTGKTLPFEFSRHMSTEPVARALAREKFTKEFRAALSENHQVHYEQAGFASGWLELASKKIKIDKLPAFRDHSYGKRDWNYFDRYVWMVALLENGDFIHTSLIRYPAVTELRTGFYDSPDKGMVCLKDATSMDMLPVTGGVPEKFEYNVIYEDKTKREVKCELDFVCPFVFGDGTYFVNEGVSDFVVNGIKGRGITEFAFNADKSRWSREKK